MNFRALEIYEFHYITNNSEGLILIHVNETLSSTVELSRFKPPPALAGLTCDRAAPDPPGAAGWTPRIPRGSQTPTQACAAGAPVYKTTRCKPRGTTAPNNYIHGKYIINTVIHSCTSL